MSYNRYFDPSQCESNQKDLIISQLKADLFELKTHFKDYDDLSKSQIQLENQYSVLLQDTNQEELECKTVEEKDQIKINNGRKKIEELKKIVSDMNQEMDQLKEQNKELSNNIEKYDAEIEKQFNELEDLEESNEKYNEEIEYLKYNCGNLQSDRDFLLKDNDLRSSKLIDYQGNLSKIEQNIKNHQYSVEELRKLVTDKTRQNELIITEIKKKNDALKQINNNIQQQNETAIEKEKEILEIEKKIQHSKLEALNATDSIEEEIINCKNLQNQLEALNKAIEIRDNQYQKDQKENLANRNENNELRNDNKILNDEVINYLQFIQELIDINKSLEEEITKMEEEDNSTRQLLQRKELMTKAILSNNKDINKSFYSIIGIKELKIEQNFNEQ